jgi:tetratricopeptide (TPR) repeat protein
MSRNVIIAFFLLLAGWIGGIADSSPAGGLTSYHDCLKFPDMNDAAGAKCWDRFLIAQENRAGQELDEIQQGYAYLRLALYSRRVKKDFPLAEILLRRALSTAYAAIPANRAELLKELGYILELQGDNDAAVKNLDEALTLYAQEREKSGEKLDPYSPGRRVEKSGPIRVCRGYVPARPETSG